jgi:hypothetical protein
MAKIPIDDPSHWRERAEEARVHAEEISDPLRIAEDLREGGGEIGPGGGATPFGLP